MGFQRQKFANNVSSTLGASLASGASTLTLATGGGASFPSVLMSMPPYDFFMATIVRASDSAIEVIRVEESDGSDTFSLISRGQEGTTPLNFVAGDTIEIRLTAGTADTFVQTDTSGNSRGDYAIDIQNYRSAATRVASGGESVALGNDIVVSGLQGIGIGYDVQNTGVRSVALGRNIEVFDDDAVLIGPDASIEEYSQYSMAFGSTAWVGWSEEAAVIGPGAWCQSSNGAIVVGPGAYCADWDLSWDDPAKPYIGQIAIGHGAWVEGRYAAAVGKKAGVHADADYSNAFGMMAEALVSGVTCVAAPLANMDQSSWQVGSPGQDDRVHRENMFMLNAGAEVTVMTHQVDLESTGVVNMDIPDGAVFFPTECGIIIDQHLNVLTYPDIRIGYGSLPEALMVETTITGITDAYQRFKATAADQDTGFYGCTLKFEVTAAASGTLTGRFYVKGMIMQDVNASAFPFTTTTTTSTTTTTTTVTGSSTTTTTATGP